MTSTVIMLNQSDSPSSISFSIGGPLESWKRPQHNAHRNLHFKKMHAGADDHSHDLIADVECCWYEFQ